MKVRDRKTSPRGDPPCLCRALLLLLLAGLTGLASPSGAVGHGEPVLTICSFNIKWLGNYKEKKNDILCRMLVNFDIVLVQELVAPPYPGAFPDGTRMMPDQEARAFFDTMRGYGFSWWLCEEDTGPQERIHTNGTGTEWWVAFYKPAVVQTAPDLPWGFLADDRGRNPCYDRVPYAFSFRTPGGEFDFVLISVHLSTTSTDRRHEELASVSSWIDGHAHAEKDFAILGDTNAQDCRELRKLIPMGFFSLNAACQPTNVSLDKPYDDALVSVSLREKVDSAFGFRVLPLRDLCDRYGPCPHDIRQFAILYSDHNPVWFRLDLPDQDDDGVASR